MLTMQSGSDFLGCGPSIKCPKCNNISRLSIKQEFFKQQAFLIPVTSKYGRIFQQCNTCETAWLLEKPQALQLLEEGKEFTKGLLHEMGAEFSRSVFKRLNALGAHDLVAYLGS